MAVVEVQAAWPPGHSGDEPGFELDFDEPPQPATNEQLTTASAGAPRQMSVTSRAGMAADRSEGGLAGLTVLARWLVAGRTARGDAVGS